MVFEIYNGRWGDDSSELGHVNGWKRREGRVEVGSNTTGVSAEERSDEVRTEGGLPLRGSRRGSGESRSGEKSGGAQL